MRVEKFNYNDPEELRANTYVVFDEDKNAVVIDPSVDSNGVINYLKKNNLSLKAILLTHAHFDHVCGVKRLVDEYHVFTYIHPLEKSSLMDPYENCSITFEKEIIIDVPTKDINDGDALNFLKENIKVLHTPYHTLGSVCFYLEDSHLLFSGDSLFKRGVGRSDLPTSSPRDMKATLLKLYSLPRETVVMPGHGNNTTIGEEKAF